jgi:cytochrome c553
MKKFLVAALALAAVAAIAALYFRGHPQASAPGPVQTAPAASQAEVEPPYDPHAATAAYKAGSTSRDIAAEMPEPPAAFAWAYPVQPHGLPRSDPAALHTAEGADPAMKLTMRQIGDAFGPPDWFPGEHPALPEIVAHGRRPHVMACILCHLPNGNGHPESASISGLSPSYIVAQFRAFRDGERKNIRAPAMVEMALDISDAELRQAAAYFANVPRKQQQWIRVVETDRAPSNHVGGGGARFFDNDGKTMPVPADMIYEVAESEQVELRNDHVGFVDFVPMGSLEKGRVVALGNHGAMRSCASCHGDDLRGHEDAPRIAGRGAYYLIRQLADMKYGRRTGKALGKMSEIIGKLSDADILNVAAYMASRQP